MQALRSCADGHAATPLFVLVDRVAAELDRLKLTVDDLQVMLSPVMAAVIHDEHSLIADVQQLDALAQALGGLAIFLRGIGQFDLAGIAMDPEPVAARVPLRDLADRLCGHSPSEEVQDFELF